MTGPIVRIPILTVTLILAAWSGAVDTPWAMADSPGQKSDTTMNKQIHNDKQRQAFEQADAVAWVEVFDDPCTGDWTEKWFLDGEVGQVTTGPDGMTLTAGPEFRNDAHHMVLWTKDEFKGDLKLEYDYTRTDDQKRCVNILYIQATGSGKPPYHRDITRWNELRRVPAMRNYYDNMNLYHISYAAFGGAGQANSSYIRGRRYMPHQHGLKGTNLKPDYRSTTLFEPGVKHHITVIKHDDQLLMRVENPDEVFYAQLSNTNLPPVIEGRIGLRHMFTRSARYENFSISQPADAATNKTDE